jgi:dTMP kinase
VFISFEGLDGCGKTTQAAMLAAALELEGRTVVRVREPGGTPIGERIRELLLDGESVIGGAAEALLYAAARAQLVEERVQPLLDEGAIVLLDRYVDSSLAYQGAGRGLGEEAVAELNRFGTGGLTPDRIESESDGFHAAVAEGFAAAAERFPERIHVVDASGPPRAVLARVREAANL